MKLNEAFVLADNLINQYLINWKFEFNTRARAVGLCDYRKRTIFFSVKFLELSDDIIKNTILHEIAHALTPGHHHDYIWKLKCIEIGCTPNRLITVTIKLEHSYKATCPICGKEFFRDRMHSKSRRFVCTPCYKIGVNTSLIVLNFVRQ